MPKNKRVLSIFVDESGILTESAARSRFYVLTLLCHDQTLAIQSLADALDNDMTAIGIANLCFHASPVIHANDQFEFMTWDLRRKIFGRMLGFARRADFRYHCIVVDKRYVNTPEQVVSQLREQIAAFMSTWQKMFVDFDSVKVYYDCGQKPITNLLHEFFAAWDAVPVEFAQAVEPRKYKLFQVADLVCTLKLLETKLDLELPFSKSETRFLGGPRVFKRNILKYIKRKEI